MNYQLLLTCEHASYQIPTSLANLFSGKQAVVMTHRGWDIGALTALQALQQMVPATVMIAEASRLVVDLNRSLHHPKIFSEFTKPLTKAERQFWLEKLYFPYRSQIQSVITKAQQEDRCVLHLAIHSFTPKLNDQVRNNDIGFLFDPKRNPEKDFCVEWRRIYRQHYSSYQVRFNYPYRGISDGLPTALRRLYSPEHYIGIEVELNQRHFGQEGNCLTGLVDDWVKSLAYLIKRDKF